MPEERKKKPDWMQMGLIALLTVAGGSGTGYITFDVRNSQQQVEMALQKQEVDALKADVEKLKSERDGLIIVQTKIGTIEKSITEINENQKQIYQLVYSMANDQ